MIERIQNAEEPRPKKAPTPSVTKVKAQPEIKEVVAPILDMTLGLKTVKSSSKPEKKATVKP